MEETEVNTPVVLLSIVTDTERKQNWSHVFYPSMKSPIKRRATAQMIAASHQMYSVKRL
jgi:hypothetical protein